MPHSGGAGPGEKPADGPSAAHCGRGAKVAGPGRGLRRASAPGSQTANLNAGAHSGWHAPFDALVESWYWMVSLCMNIDDNLWLMHNVRT